MKPSHFTTPRTMAECHFQTGYRPALPRDWMADMGHFVLGAASVIGCVLMVGLLVMGAL